MQILAGDPPYRHLASAREPSVYDDPQPPKPATVLPPARRYLTPVSGGSHAGLRVHLNADGRIRLSANLYRLLSGHEPNTPIPNLYVRLAIADSGALIIERCKDRDQYAGLVNISTNQLNQAFNWDEFKKFGYRAGWFFAESNEAGTEATIRPDGYLGEYMRARRKGGKAA